MRLVRFIRARQKKWGATTRSPGQSKRNLAITVAVSAAIGFLIGVGPASTWQVAVESAQAISGVISYPDVNPFYRYHITAWTLLNQLLAVFLTMGIDERTLSMWVSGLLAALNFSGLSLWCFVLCRNTAASVLAPLITHITLLTSSYYGVVYPVMIAASPHTYGVLGRSLALLTLGLLAVRWYRGAFLLMGLAPALHLIWGSYAIFLGMIGLALSRRPIREYATRWPYFAAGIAVTGTSFLIQQVLKRGLPPVNAEESERLLRIFMTYWDFHREPAPFLHYGTWIVLLGCVLVFMFLRNGSEGPDTSRRFITMSYLLAGAAGLCLMLVTHFFRLLPDLVAVAMPGRFINLPLLLAQVVLLAVLVTRSNRWFDVLLGAHFSFVVWNWFFRIFLESEASHDLGTHLWKELAFVSVAMLGLAYVLRNRPGERDVRKMTGPQVLWPAVIVGVLMLTMPTKNEFASLPREREDPVILEAQLGSGSLINGPKMFLMQIRTRRPIMMNFEGGINQIVYVPDSGPAINELLNEIYGTDLTVPPKSVGHDFLQLEHIRAVFENRPSDEWQSLGDRYSATQVIVRADWDLQLPLRSESEAFRLYDISP